MQMNIATALNRKYIMYTGVMLTSLCQNNRDCKIRIFLLHSELTEQDIAFLRNALAQYDAEIEPLKVKKELFDERLPHNEQWSMETYYRLLLLELLPAEVERLLYLDGDMIVNKSLREVYEAEFETDDIIACEDCCGEMMFEAFSEKQQEMFAEKVQQGFRYFNAGFMLLNIAQMRKHYSFDTYLEAMKRWDYAMRAPDQDILNDVHWNKVGYADYQEYDLFARIAYNRGMTYEEVKEKTAVIHYAGSKPWEATNVHHKLEQIWWDYAKSTPFYLELLEGFVKLTMSDTTVTDYIKNLINENNYLKENLLKMADLIRLKG